MRVTNPHTRLKRLYRAVISTAHPVQTETAITDNITLADTIGKSVSWLSQNFAKNLADKDIGEDLLLAISAAFNARGVPVQLSWFAEPLETFEARLAPAHHHTTPGNARADTDLPLPDLVELRLHQPTAQNEPNSYLVKATLLFGTAHIDIPPDAESPKPRTLALALREARLAIGAPGDTWQPAQGNLLGERTESKNYRRVAGGVEITGETNQHGHLAGAPIGDEPFATIEPSDDTATPGADRFTILVSAPLRSIDITDPDAPLDTHRLDNANKEAVLDIILSKSRPRTESNHRILARATMRPKRSEP